MQIAATGQVNSSPNDPILYGEATYEAICSSAARDGFRAIELHILDSNAIDRTEVYRALENHRLKLTSIGTGAVYFSRGYSLSSPDREIRKKCIRHMAAHLETAQPYGAVVIVGCVQGRLQPGQRREELLNHLRDSLTELDDLAGRMNVQLGLEAMNRFESDALNSIEEACTFLRSGGFSHTGLHIDTVHMNIEEANIADAIRSAAGMINHVHVADNNRRYPGQAHYPFEETIRALQDIGYDGALALETKPYPDSQTAGRKSLAYLSALLDR